MTSIESMSALSATSVMQTAHGQDSRRAEFEAKFKEAALAAGLDPSAADGLQDEIDSAIAAATQKSDGTTDRRQVIQNAIDGVLQKHGVDLEKFRSLMQPATGGAGGPPSGPPPASDSRRAEFQAEFTDAAVAAGLDPTEADSLQNEIDSAISNVLENTDDATDPRQAIQDAIDALLKEHGVDLDKFKSLLQSSMGGAQGTFPLVDEQA